MKIVILWSFEPFQHLSNTMCLFSRKTASLSCAALNEIGDVDCNRWRKMEFIMHSAINISILPQTNVYIHFNVEKTDK